MHDHSGSMRSSILSMFHTNNSISNLSHLVQYLNQRFPVLKIARRQIKVQIEQSGDPFENSKTNLHLILNFYDPAPRSKAILPKPITTHEKGLGPFRRAGTKLKICHSLSRSHEHSKVHYLTVPTHIK